MSRKSTALFLCAILLFSLSRYGVAEGLSLFLNKMAISGGDTLELSVAVNGKEIPATVADVYLSVQFPNGKLYYLQGDFASFAEENEVVPLVTEWPIRSLEKITLLTLEIPRRMLPSGTYKWYVTLSKPATDVTQPANWIATTSVSLILSDSYEPSGDDLVYAAPPSSSVEKETAYDDTPMSSPIAPPAAPVSETSTTDSAGGEMVYDGVAKETDGDYDEFPCCVISPKPPTDDIPPQSGLLTAGDIDDNLNLAAFQRYLNRSYQNDNEQIFPTTEVSDRITLHIVDAKGQGVSHARVRISTNNTAIETDAGTDGQFYLFPRFDLESNDSQLALELAPPEDALGSPSTSLRTTLDLNQLSSDRTLTFTLPSVINRLPTDLDILLVIDTTGSMGDEIEYLTTEFRDIMAAVSVGYPQVRMRFGLVTYRDKGDIYVVRDFPFSDSINVMQNQLGEQHAGGGGDYPEAMEEALAIALKADWRSGNVARLLFLVADAPPHDENLGTMLKQIRLARNQGLHIYPVGASGVADTAELILRTAAVVTQGRYLFLTDDSGVGYSHSEPKIACYLVSRLDQLISRVIASELAGQRIEPEETQIIRRVGQYEAGICGESTTPVEEEKSEQ